MFSIWAQNPKTLSDSLFMWWFVPKKTTFWIWNYWRLKTTCNLLSCCYITIKILRQLMAMGIKLFALFFFSSFFKKFTSPSSFLSLAAALWESLRSVLWRNKNRQKNGRSKQHFNCSHHHGSWRSRRSNLKQFLPRRAFIFLAFVS